MSVFLSYAFRDKPRIKKVIKELKAMGAVKEDDEIIDSAEMFEPGTSVRAQVREAIDAASKVVIVWSGSAAGSGWVNYETGMAEALGKSILIAVPKGEAMRLPSNLEGIRVVELETIR
jgi:hypothetical protein